MNFIDKYILPKRKKYYYKSNYYKNNFYDFNFFERLSLFNNYDRIKTQVPIIFRNSINFNETYDEVISLLGKPRYLEQNTFIKTYQVAYYKSCVSNIKTRFQVHFYNKKFFYGIQIFPYLNDLQNEELLNLLKIKYQLPEPKEIPFKIIDSENRSLIVDKILYLSFEYLTNDLTILESLKNEYQYYQQKQTFKELKQKDNILKII